MERRKVYRIIEERNLVSVANDSRWISLFSKLMSHRLPARLKHIAWAEVSEWSAWIIPVPNYLEIVAAGPVHFREIEWVDFDCAAVGLPCAVCTAVAREAKLTSEVRDPLVRIFGYRRPHSAPPELAK